MATVTGDQHEAVTEEKNVMNGQKECCEKGPQIPDWVFEQHAGEFVALSSDRQSVLAAGATGEEVIAVIEAKNLDRKEFFIERVRPRNVALV